MNPHRWPLAGPLTLGEKLMLLVAALLAASAFSLANAATAAHAAVAVPNGSCVQHVTNGYPAVSCLNKTWHCTGEQHHLQVNVRIDSPADKLDAVHLDAGCTGSIRFRITTDSGDGIKVHDGAHDLDLWFGRPAPFSAHRQPAQGAKVGILCDGKVGIVHQDGIQAMGGLNVAIHAPNIDCNTGNNGGLFCNTGSGGQSVPTNIVVYGGFVYEGNAAIHVGESSDHCGAVGVTMKTDQSKASPANCIRITKGATDPVDEGNRCLTPKP